MNLWITSEKLKEEESTTRPTNKRNWICHAAARGFPRSGRSRPGTWPTISRWPRTRPAERWQWVYNGIRAAARRGHPQQPQSGEPVPPARLIWFHKVGQLTDDKHWYYKRNWAATMEIPARPAPAAPEQRSDHRTGSARGRGTATLPELLQREPQLAGTGRRSVQPAGVDVEPRRTANDCSPLEDTFFRPYTAWRLASSSVRLRTPEQSPRCGRNSNAASARLWRSSTRTRGFDGCSLTASQGAPRAVKMDPAYMLAPHRTTGNRATHPIDWRTPGRSRSTGQVGRRQAGQYRRPRNSNLLNTDRIQLFSLATVAKQGDTASG